MSANDLNWPRLKPYMLVCNPEDRAVCEEATKRANCDQMTDIIVNEYQEKGKYLWIDREKTTEIKLPVNPTPYDDIKPFKFDDWIKQTMADRYDSSQKIYIIDGKRYGEKHWLDDYFRRENENDNQQKET